MLDNKDVSKKEVVNSFERADIHGQNHVVNDAVPFIANNPFPMQNPNVPDHMVSLEGDKKSNEILLALTKNVNSKEEFRSKFNVSDASAYQYYTSVLALRNGEKPVIKSNEILVDSLRAVSFQPEFKKLSGLDDKLNSEYYNFVIGLKGNR